MSAPALKRHIAGFAAYAHRSLLLALLVVALIRFGGGDGGWFNDFAVLLILCLPLAVRAAWRRAG